MSSEAHLARKPENASKFSLILQTFELLLVDVQGKEGRRQSKRQGKGFAKKLHKILPGK